MNAAERLQALRAAMAEKGFDYYIIPSEDAHLSEYVAPYWRVRAWFSGFSGSAGTLIVTAEEAFLWVDGRYHIQAETQVQGSGITLMKMGLEGVPEIEVWLKSTVKAGETVAMDGRMVNLHTGMKWEKSLPKARFVYDQDLAEPVWSERPALPEDPVWELDEVYAGESRAKKLERVREAMAEKEADLLILASLDDIAWLTNLRGNDIRHTPVFYAYCLITQDKAVLFAMESKFSAEIRAHLEADGIELAPYDALAQALQASKDRELSVMLDPSRINMFLNHQLSEKWEIIETTDPTTLMKACKNPVECQHIRQAHVKDGVAMVRFLRWLKNAVKDEAHPVDEVDIADVLEQYRREGGAFDLSFGTIAGYGPNGAMCHYSAVKETAAVLRPEGLIVVDSGGQYYEGTTDITRTIALGPLTEEMKHAYTLVLKGHLALGRAKFLEGTTGHYLDILARQPLWNEGKDFLHGTGHGVGFVLSVHEGPARISRASSNTVTLKEGMLLSDEPGYYPAGKFGVRIENLVLVEKREKTEDGQFMGMDFVTLCPYEMEAIDRSMLTVEEIDQINAYNRRVYQELSPYLDQEDKQWLAEAVCELR